MEKSWFQKLFEKKITGQTLTKTVIIDGQEFNSDIVGILVKPYPLEDLEYNILISGSDWPTDWTKRFFFIAIGFTLNILGKAIYFLYMYKQAKGEVTQLSDLNRQPLELNIEGWELIALALAYFAVFFSWIMTKIVKTEKSQIKDNISRHFKRPKK